MGLERSGVNASDVPDVWAIGDGYEPYVGRWSRLVARDFLTWLAIPAAGRWLDVGCGTGALTATILDLATPSGVVGIDPSSGFLAFARDRHRDPRVRFERGDAQALPVESDGFDAVVAGLVINFVPDPAQAVREMMRAARPDGTVAAYVWDYAGGMQMMAHFWDAAASLDPTAQTLNEVRRFGDRYHMDGLRTLFMDAGLRDVSTRAMEISTLFRDFDDYWTPFLAGQGSAPSYAMSLDEEHRTTLRDRLREHLPVAPDGSIPLTARAWAVRGSR